jgi:glycerophosphoryl diester phosphodiesterase
LEAEFKSPTNSQGGQVWISHRGCRQRADENTLEAFKDARARGFKAFETDLRQSADGHLILIHDYNLKRLSDIDNTVGRVHRRALSSIRLKKGGRLLFLDQFLEFIAGCRLTLDIKPEQGEAVIANLIQFAMKNNLTDWIRAQVKFLTWRPPHESMLLSAFPGVRFYARPDECRRAGLYALTGIPGLGAIVPGRTYAVTPHLLGLPLFRKSLIRRYTRRGAMTVAYLPKTPRQAGRALQAGMDEILTDGLIFV